MLDLIRFESVCTYRLYRLYTHIDTAIAVSVYHAGKVIGAFASNLPSFYATAHNIKKWPMADEHMCIHLLSYTIKQLRVIVIPGGIVKKVIGENNRVVVVVASYSNSRVGKMEDLSN